MDRKQFINIFDGVRNQRKYSNLELERIYHHVKSLTADEFGSICIKFLDIGARPNVHDFKNAARLFGHLPESNSKDEGDVPFRCDQCHDTGIVDLMISSLHIYAHCFCGQQKFVVMELATHPSEQTINAKYIGPGSVPFKPGIDSALQSMEFYKQRLRDSEKFWKQFTKEKNNG